MLEQRDADLALTQPMPATPSRSAADAQPGALRRDIQGLRGVAVLLVVLYHAGVPFVPGGYIGVDVFFVISGFLITGLLVREIDLHSTIDYAAFILRRVRRLLPASVAVLAVVALASLLIYPPLERVDILSAARAAAVYAGNLWFAGRAFDYLGGAAASNPVLHMWSLAVEEQFYLVWPWLLALAAWRAGRGGARVRILNAVLATSALTLAACVWMTWHAQPWAFFGMPFRAWEFGLGAVVYLMTDRLRQWPPAWLHGAGLAGAASVLLGAALLDDTSLFPGLWALVPAGGTALAIASLQGNAGGKLRGLLSSPPLTRIGDVSYSWYLWHWPALVAVPVLMPESGALAKAVAVALSYVVAELSYRFVEEPFRHGAALSVPPRRVALAAIAFTLGAAGLFTLMKGQAANADLGRLQKQFAQARNDIPVVYSKRCHLPYAATAVVACEAGSVTADRVLVLMGDSHAAHWYPALEAVAQQRRWRLVSMTKSGCPWVDVPVQAEALRREYWECKAWRDHVLARIAGIASPLVVLANSNDRAYDAQSWQAGAQRTLAALTARGADVAVLRDTPSPGFDVPACLARADHRGESAQDSCRFSLSAQQTPLARLAEAEQEAAAAVKGAARIDMTRFICAQEHCAVMADDNVHFSDHGHLSASFSRQLAPALAAELDAARANNRP